MNNTIYIILSLVLYSACGVKEADTAQVSDTNQDTGAGNPEPDPVQEPTIPDCLVEPGTALYGFVGRLDHSEDGVNKQYVREERTIAIYETLTENDIVGIEGNYIGFGIVEEIEPLYTVQSYDGCYSFMVDPGEYSVVASYGDGWFCGEAEGICVLNLESEARRDFIWDNTVDY